jgi:hypothetical protein
VLLRRVMNPTLKLTGLALIVAAAMAGSRLHAQTVVLPNAQTAVLPNEPTSGNGANSDPLSVPAASQPPASSSLSVSSPNSTGTISAGSELSPAGSGGPGPASASRSSGSQAPLLLPGEIPDTSTQAASTTAAAPAPPPPICPPPVPSSDGGSANLTDIGGFSPNGC